MDLDKISSWLGVTGQQFEILRVVYDMQSTGKKTNPKNILDEYERTYKKSIQRQNLFTQIRPLIDSGLIKRKEKALYTVDIQTMRHLLKGRGEELRQEIKEFDDFSKEIEDYMKQISLMPSEPTVRYLDQNDFFNAISDSLNTAVEFYLDTSFPNIIYTEPLAESIERSDYVQIINKRCLKDETLSVYYLTNLKIEVTFLRALNIFRSPKLAYNECKTVISQLEEQINSARKMDIRYLDPLPGPHMYIFGAEDKLLGKIFVALRGSNVIFKGKALPSGPYGGVEIISPEVARKAKDLFMDSFDMAEELSGKGGEKRIDQVRKNLDAVYKKHVA